MGGMQSSNEMRSKPTITESSVLHRVHELTSIFGGQYPWMLIMMLDSRRFYVHNIIIVGNQIKWECKQNATLS